MFGEYFVVSTAVILTILAGAFEIIRKDMVGDYIGFFFAFLIIGFALLWVYRQVRKLNAKQP